MSLQIPTTQEIFERNLTLLENSLNQTSPLADKAFLRVLATILAMNYVELNKMNAERALQNFALTATGDDLNRIGSEYNIIRKAAEAAVLQMLILATGAIEVPAGTVWIGQSNNVRYRTNETITAPGYVNVTSELAGVVGNLNTAEILSIETAIPGILPIGAVSIGADDPDVPNLGVEEESQDAYRRRVLNEIRTVGGGGNGVDYRTWAEETSGVNRAFPYAGAPVGIGFLIPELIDGSMEAINADAWIKTGDGTVSKSMALPKSGIRCLEVQNASTLTGAYQSILTAGARYHLTGWGRGDGGDSVTRPVITDGIDGNVLWTGNATTDWKQFDFYFTAESTEFILTNDKVTGGGDPVFFDELVISLGSLAGDRTVYVECDSSIDPDGVPPQSLLNETRDNININPATGKGRPPLGEIDETLFVEPITRTGFDVVIYDLNVSADVEAATKTSIETALTEYFLSITCYCEGVDSPINRDDTITTLTLSSVIQDILNPVGGTAGSVVFKVEGTSEYLPAYRLGQGELAKEVSVTYG